MAWDIIGVSTYVEVASGNITLNDPGGQQGDLLVACVAYRSNVAFTLPSGWSLVATQQSSGDIDATQGIASGVMAYIIRGASAPSFVFTRTGGDVAQGTVICYRGNQSSPYDTGNAATLAVIGEPALAAISTANGGELIVAMISAGDNSLTSAVDAATAPSVASGATNTTTDPTDDTWIERFDRDSYSGADTGLCVADGVKVNSGTTGAFSANAVATTRSVFIVGAFRILVVTYEYGTATLSGLGTLVGNAFRTRGGLATLSGSGLVACIGTIVSGAIEYGTATLSGIGTLVGSAYRIRGGLVTLSGVGSLVASSVVTFVGKATLAGAGSLIGLARRTRAGVSSLSGSGTLSAIGNVALMVLGSVSMLGQGILSGIGKRLRQGYATITGVGSIIAKATMTYWRVLKIDTDVTVSQDLNMVTSETAGLKIASTVSPNLFIAKLFRGG